MISKNIFQPLRLNSVIQPHVGGKPYDWGEKGPSSYIARLLNITEAPNDQPFSELWMGTHKEGPSTLESDGQIILLSDYIAQIPTQVLGKKVATTYQNSLPFLFKVLSAAEILSIQVHPNKEQAIELRHKDPEHYPDSNHKPEMAVVLDELSVLAGLKNRQEIVNLPIHYPELLSILGQDIFNTSPSKAFVTLIENGVKNPSSTTQTIQNIAQRLKSNNSKTAQDEIFLELFKTNPEDIGLLSVFFLNHYLLKENQAMFTPPGMPHAYVRGNIIEVMANSDMVIRIGPTPKFRDVSALGTVITEAQPTIYDSQSSNFTYASPAKEFCVHKYELEINDSAKSISDSARIILILSGEITINGNVYGKGSSILIPASLEEVNILCNQTSKFFIVDTPIL